MQRNPCLANRVFEIGQQHENHEQNGDCSPKIDASAFDYEEKKHIIDHFKT